MQFLFAVVLGLTFAGIRFAVSAYREKKRVEAMDAWAAARRWRFDASGGGVLQEFAGKKIFQRGYDRRVQNCASGLIDGVDVRVVDYRYKTGSGKNSRTWHHTLAIVSSGRSDDLHFFCRRQVAFLDALGKVFGGQDINFDEDEAFSSAWVLQTNDDEARVRAVMTPRLRATLTALAKKDLVVELAGGSLIAHVGRQLAPDAIDGLIDDAVRVRQSLR